MSKPAKKVAIFVHGWNATGATWSRPRWNPNPIKRLFESKGYAVVPIDMPDKYIAPKKECYHYAEYLSQKVEEHALAKTTTSDTGKYADEITLVTHSMGGVATLLYLREDIGNTEAKEKINRVITIASPNHGIDVPLKHIAHIFALLFGGISEDALVSRIGACYRQIKLASPFMQKLNPLPEHAPNVEYHCIWTRGDVAIVPNHTAIIPGANNYYINSLRVGHLNILWSKQTLQIIKAILDGNPIPSGLQTYPPADTGAGHAHLWFPSSGKNRQLPLWSPGEKRYYLWSCRNEGCNETAVSIKRPPLAGCAIGQLDEKYRWHRWRRTGGKRYKCLKCKRVVRVTSRPSATASPECGKGINPRRHDWILQSQQWVCKNETRGRKCGKKAWSLLMPGLLGCPVGIRKTKWHLWKKEEPRFQYKFKCAVCRETVWHPDLNM